MSLCFWCGVESKFKLKSGKFCCCETPNKCIGFRKKNSLSHKGNIHSQETRSKISLSNKGRIVTVETKEKIKESMKRKKETGWINHPESTKIKMSEKLKGRKISNETTKKRLESRKGYRHTEETKEKIRLSNIGNIKHTIESKRTLSERNKKLWKDSSSYFRSEENRKRQSDMMKNGFAAYMCSKIRSPSKPQIQLYEISKELFPSSILQYKINNFCVDIAIPDMKIILEYDCWYWHQDEEKDLKRQKEIESLGWKFIRFRDYIPNKEQLYKEVSNVQTF